MLRPFFRRSMFSGRRALVLLGCLAVISLEAATLVFLPKLAPWSAPEAHAAGQNAIQIENSLPGDPNWGAFSANLSQTALSGYASQTSINHGQSIDFYVTTTASSFQIQIYRTGWYQGDGARLIETMGTYTGVQQPACPLSSQTGMVSCTNWSKTATLNVPSSWTTGVYLAKLEASNDDSFIIFVVRDDGGHEPLVFQTSVDTYEAYNTYGGTSLYNNLTDGSVYAPAHAVKESFDRPFNPGDGNGAGQFFSYEYPFIRWAEEQGFEITYTTNVDTSTGVNPLTNHKAFISVGHDEYWSMNMRNNVQAAINAGVNVAFFSANTCYWQVRFEPNAQGVANRVMVGYKDFADSGPFPGPDPELGVNNSLVTTNFRDPVVNMPENGLLGVMYENSDQNPTSTYVVQNSSNWVYANSGFVDGSTVPGIVGYEYDKVWDNGATPAGLTILGNSPVVGIGDDSGVGGIANSHSNSSIYTTPSGAMVFASGTIEWSWGLDNWPNRNFANSGIQQTTDNILYRFTGTTPPPPPAPPPSGTYFTDGFESGNLTKWMGPLGTGQATSAESTVVNSGSHAAQLTDASGQYSYLYTPLVGGQESLTYTRFYFQIGSDNSGTTELAQGSNVSGGFSDFSSSSTTTTTKSDWVVYYDYGLHRIDAIFSNGAGTNYALYSNPNIVSPGAWYGLEVEDNEQASGVGQVWLNGGSIINTGSVDLSTTTPVNTLTINNTTAGTVYYDDIVVSNAYNGPVGGSYPGPSASVNPTSLTFASQNVHTTSSPQAITLSNTGNAPMTVNSVTVSGTNSSDFTANSSCPTSVAANGSCTINVTFTPSGSGTRTATLTIADSAPGSPQTIALSGTGFFPPPPADGIYFSDGFENGLSNWSTPSGTGQASVESTVVNSGSSALALTDSSGQYITVSGALIGGGETLTYTRFYFRVASPANSVSTLAQGFDQSGNLLWVVVYDSSRHGIDGYFWNGARTRFDLYSVTNIVSPDTWYGLEIEDNEQSTGHAEIWLNGASIASVNGDLSVTNGYSQLTLLNAATGTTYFDDVIISNKYNGPVGSGYPAPGSSLNPTSLSFGNQNTGSISAAQSITLTNNGTQPLVISTAAVGGTNSGDFVKMSDTCSGATVAPNATCSVAISFDPTASGARSATLTITDNAPGGSQTVALSGTGVTPPPPPPPPSGVYFSDGFESGNLNLWNAPAGNGQASVETSVVNSGSDAVALTNASGQFVSISAGLIGGPETLTYTSFAFRIAASAAGSTTTLAQGTDANGDVMWVIVYDAGRKGLDVYVWNGARTRYDLYSNQNVIAADTWYTLELEMNEVVVGQAQVWLNGTSIASGNADLSTSEAYTQLTVMNQVAGTIYFDDVKVANTQ
jgi:Abnormal spindle-like microcephaly-assoc'd, ASPM-SPD-2-Hydin